MSGLIAWEFEPSAALGVGATALVYASGVRAIWRRAGAGRGVRRWQVGMFAGAIATLCIALLSPLDPLAEQLFAAHMTQHVLLAMVAPPLFVLGAPHAAFAWAVPSDGSKSLAAFFNRIRRQTWWRAVSDPPVAAVLHAVALWSWHLPRLYQSALVHPGIHALEHTTLLGTGVLLWWSILGGRLSRSVSYGIGVATLFFTMLSGTALGALITLSSRLWYPAQSVSAAAWGLTPLADQQTAGLIMWVVGGLLELTAVGALFVAWMNSSTPSSRRQSVGRSEIAASV